MAIQDHPLKGGNTDKLIEILKSNNEKLIDLSLDKIHNAIKIGFRAFSIPKKNGKLRPIEAPNKDLKLILSALSKSLQTLDCPEYNFCGWKKQNTLQAAKKHLNAHAYFTADISKYYPNTKAIYVRKFFEKFNTDKKTLDLLVKLTTFRNHLPTGAPTSPILAFLSHQELFDEINEKMKEESITFTLYADDVGLSAKHGITNETLGYIRSVIAKHQLQAHPEKSQHFSYKKAKMLGYYLLQNGKIDVPFSQRHKVIKKLKEKSIYDMSINELEKLLGKINYIHAIDNKAFKITRIKVIKRLKQLYTERFISVILGYSQHIMYH